MENSATASAVTENLVICQSSEGNEIRATVLRLPRDLVVFEIHNPYLLRLSEALTDFKILVNETVIFSGRAVVSNLINTGTVVIVEASLDGTWHGPEIVHSVNQGGELQILFSEFRKEWGRISRISPEFKLVTADMQALLADLRRWMEQVELGVRSESSRDRHQIEHEILEQLQAPIVATVSLILEKFEETAGQVESDLRPLSMTYFKRQIHPLALCSPFLYRTFKKPLGYAGDYEMVNMMLRDPFEGSSMFAKMLNRVFLNIPPVVAHRDRITYLIQLLLNEAKRAACQNRAMRVFNLGCGPAKEVQDFLAQHHWSDRTEFTLLDFNEETFKYTGKILEELRVKHGRRTRFQMVRKSVNQLLKDASRPHDGTSFYDLVYCAGLFDYLNDAVCKRLMNFFYDLLAPGGLLVVTNVDSSNPSQNLMEYISDWHLVYRNRHQMESLKPDAADSDYVAINSIGVGVNISMEVRKPENGQ